MVRDVTLTIVLNRRGRMSRKEDQTFAGQVITMPETQIAENSTCRVLWKVSTREEVIPSGFDDVEGRRRVLGNRADRRSSFLLSRRTAAIALARVRACEDLPVRLPASRRQTTGRSRRPRSVLCPLRLDGLVAIARGDAPDPIPNSAVKTLSANGTAPQGAGE